MQGILVATPVILAIAMGIVAAGSKRGWMLGVLAIALAESMLTSSLVPSSELPGALSFTVLIPWLLVAAYVALAPYPRRPILVAVFVPVVYAGALAISVIVGVNLGALQV